MSSMECWSRDPCYEWDLEPPELKCVVCSNCAEAVASINCQLCDRAYCATCEHRAHSNHVDAASHQRSCALIHVCQGGGGKCTRPAHFFCFDCERHQCKLCCSIAHQRDSDSTHTHVYVCLEDAPTRLLQHCTWSPAFLDMVMMPRRTAMQALVERDVALATSIKQEHQGSDFIPVPSVDEDDTSDEEDLHDNELRRQVEQIRIKRELARIKSESESARLCPIKTEQASTMASNVGDSIDQERPTQNTTRTKTEPHVAVGASRGGPGDAIDLTEEDDEDDEPVVHQNHTVFDRISNTNPLLDGLISGYTRQSTRLCEIETAIRQSTKEANSATSYAQIQECKQRLAAMKNEWTKLRHERHATVARLLLTQCKTTDDAASLIANCSADLAEAEDVIHQQCATLSASIQEKREALQRCKREVAHLIQLHSSGAREELRRLGVCGQEWEVAIGQLDALRLHALLSLVHVSADVRSAVQLMLR